MDKSEFNIDALRNALTTLLESWNVYTQKKFRTRN